LHTWQGVLLCPLSSASLPTTAQFVLFLGYMPIISSSLRVLDCTPPLDGVRYLRSDLRVPCGEGEHVVGAGVAYAVIVGLGVGFPAALGWMLSTASPEALAQPSFQSAWGFLISGYRTSDGEAQRVEEAAAALVEARQEGVTDRPALDDRERACVRHNDSPHASSVDAGRQSLVDGRSARASTLHPPPSARDTGVPLRVHVPPHDAVLEWYCTWRPQRLLWWESVVMVRKAGIVLLAVLVTNPFFQCAGAALLLWFALTAHLQQQPYSKRLFNLLEAASLIAAASTAVIAATLLQYDVTAPEFASQPPASMTRTQWAVTIALGAMNLGTLALLAAAWAYLTAQTVRKHVKVLRVGRQPKVPRPSDGGTPALASASARARPRRSTMASLAALVGEQSASASSAWAVADASANWASMEGDARPGSAAVARLGGSGMGETTVNPMYHPRQPAATRPGGSKRDVRGAARRGGGEDRVSLTPTHVRGGQ
jgi:hypothetical protein